MSIWAKLCRVMCVKAPVGNFKWFFGFGIHSQCFCANLVRWAGIQQQSNGHGVQAYAL